MQAAPSAVEVRRPVAEEEAARADFYALLGALFSRPPDERLLRSLALAAPLEGGEQVLAKAWSDLVAASAVMEPEAAAEEFEALFVGVGKAKVSCYAGYYQGGPMAVDHPRVRIIADLAALGLGRPAGVTDPEDHYAGLFDVMRILVMGGAGRQPASLAEQRRFYEAHIKPGVGKFLEAVRAAPESNYYGRVAAVGEAFVGIENESFNLG